MSDFVFVDCGGAVFEARILLKLCSQRAAREGVVCAGEWVSAHLSRVRNCGSKSLELGQT